MKRFLYIIALLPLLFSCENRPSLVEQRKAEGAKIVEMEQAGCIAIAQYRSFDYGAIIYGGDDVSQDDWDTRSWDKRKGIRYNLVMLCKELVKEI